MDTFEERQLYGGAITAELPTRLQDVSSVRDVPDHQEVLVDASVDQSLTVEILERQSIPDEGSGAFFFQDLASLNEAVSSHISSTAILGAEEVPHLPPDTYCCLVEGRQVAAKGRQAADAANEVHVLLALLRLAPQQSELLLVLNTAAVVSAASAAAADVGAGPKATHLAARPLLARVLRTLRVRDWGLFGASGGGAVT